MKTQDRKNYTIEDIAQELGVSITTVSRAISGKGRIGAATRERVMRFIEEHDYRPNVMARGLAQRKTYNLALLLPLDYAATEFQFFKDCMNGICEVASQYDYDIIVSMVEGEDLAQVRRLVANRKADGMILSRSVLASAQQEYLKQNEVPFVVIGPCDDPEILSVDNQNAEAGEELTELMLMKGLRRIALFGGKRSYNVTGSRYQGYVQAHQKQGVPLPEELVFMDIDHQAAADRALTRALQAGADAILCMDDVICNMAVAGLKARRLIFPEEIRIASLYDSQNLEFCNPPVTSVRFDTVRLGQNACIKLLKLLGEEIQEEETPLNYQVILRESTK